MNAKDREKARKLARDIFAKMRRDFHEHPERYSTQGLAAYQWKSAKHEARPVPSGNDSMGSPSTTTPNSHREPVTDPSDS